MPVLAKRMPFLSQIRHHAPTVQGPRTSDSSHSFIIDQPAAAHCASLPTSLAQVTRHWLTGVSCRCTENNCTSVHSFRVFSTFGLAHAQLHGYSCSAHGGIVLPGLWDLGARTRGSRQHPSPRSPSAIPIRHSPFRVQDFQGCETRQACTESLAAASHLPPVIGAP